MRLEGQRQTQHPAHGEARCGCWGWQWRCRRRRRRCWRFCRYNDGAAAHHGGLRLGRRRRRHPEGSGPREPVGRCLARPGAHHARLADIQVGEPGGNVDLFCQRRGRQRGERGRKRCWHDAHQRVDVDRLGVAHVETQVVVQGKVGAGFAPHVALRRRQRVAAAVLAVAIEHDVGLGVVRHALGARQAGLARAQRRGGVAVLADAEGGVEERQRHVRLARDGAQRQVAHVGVLAPAAAGAGDARQVGDGDGVARAGVGRIDGNLHADGAVVGVGDGLLHLDGHQPAPSARGLGPRLAHLGFERPVEAAVARAAAPAGRRVGSRYARAASAAHVGPAVLVAPARRVVAHLASLAAHAGEPRGALARRLLAGGVEDAVVQAHVRAHPGEKMARVAAGHRARALRLVLGVVVGRHALAAAGAHDAVQLGACVLAGVAHEARVALALAAARLEVDVAVAVAAAPGGALGGARRPAEAAPHAAAAARGLALAHAAVHAAARLAALQLVVGPEGVRRREELVAALAAAAVGLAHAVAVARRGVVAETAAAAGGTQVVRGAARRQAPPRRVVNRAIAVLTQVAAQQVRAGALRHAVDLGARAVVLAGALVAPAAGVRPVAVARRQHRPDVAVSRARGAVDDAVHHDVQRVAIQDAQSDKSAGQQQDVGFWHGGAVSMCAAGVR